MSRRVVLVTGFLDTARLFRRMEGGLRAAGYRPETFALRPSSGVRGLDALALDLDAWLRDRLDPDESFALLGFSMGGIVARYYAQRLGGAARLRRLILLSTPNHGTAWAWLLPFRGIRQLRPGSAFLRGLDRDLESLAPARPACIWSPLDQMMLPPSTARLPPFDERRLWVPLHAWIPRSRAVLRTVLGLLAEAGT